MNVAFRCMKCSDLVELLSRKQDGSRREYLACAKCGGIDVRICEIVSPLDRYVGGAPAYILEAAVKA